MRSTVTIEKQGDIYLCSVSCESGVGYQGRMAGHTAKEAAEVAVWAMLKYSQTNKDGGDLMAPDEVLKLIPAHLCSMDASYGWHWVDSARDRHVLKIGSAACVKRSHIDWRAKCDRRVHERRASCQAMA